MKIVETTGLAEGIAESLKGYTAEIEQITRKAVEETAKDVDQEIKAHCSFKGSGGYIKSFSIKTVEDNKGRLIKKWHVKPPNYRLTHLLEYGHALAKGSKRARAFPHIKYGEAIAQANLQKRVEEGIDAIR